MAVVRPKGIGAVLRRDNPLSVGLHAHYPITRIRGVDYVEEMVRKHGVPRWNLWTAGSKAGSHFPKTDWGMAAYFFGQGVLSNSSSSLPE